MPTTTRSGTKIEYDTLGTPDDPTVLLVMGLGQQLVAWHPEFCDELVDRGYHVVRFDNRDVGLSEKFDDAGIPDVFAALMSGTAPDPPYTLDDMAADAVAVLDAVGIESAHVAGVSMGGMIAQTIAINHGERVRSLTSIMSTTGNGSLPRGTPEAYQALLAPPPPRPEPDLIVERGLRNWKVLASPAYPTPDEQWASWLLRDFERSYYPQGISRQLYAIMAHGDRRAGLRELEIPAVVLHGADDPLIPVECGEDTAETIPNAELRVIDGMAHDFPLQLIDHFADAIVDAARRA